MSRMFVFIKFETTFPVLVPRLKFRIDRVLVLQRINGEFSLSRRIDLLVVVEITRGHRGYGKIRSGYIHGVASIFPHTYIHFPSTSSMRYIASLRDDVGDPEFAFPRKIRQGREGESERGARIETRGSIRWFTEL